MDAFSLAFLALLATPFAAGLLGYALRPRLDAWPARAVLPANGGGWCEDDEPSYRAPAHGYGHGLNPTTGSMMLNQHVDMEGRGFGQGYD